MDYRESHLQRGKTYDEYLENEPLSAYMTRIESSLLQRIVPSLFTTPPTYLDFACGTARITSVVAPMASTSYGVDISESMLEKAIIKCSNTQFIHKDITKEALDISPVELITSFRFFGNAQDALRSEVLAELNKLLQKDGYLLINNHRNSWSLQYILRRLDGGKEIVDLSPAKLKRLLNENGFTIVKSYGIAAWIVRAALIKPKYLNSSIARYLEPLSRLPGLHFISPDALIVAKKTRELTTP